MADDPRKDEHKDNDHDGDHAKRNDHICLLPAGNDYLSEFP